jgi:arylsulfatase A-like enzyme
MTTGRAGLRTGVVNHGGERSVPFNAGRRRTFRDNLTEHNWASQFKEGGYHTVAFSPFAERHGAWHWYAGFMEMHNTGGGGNETADTIAPQVNDWLGRHAGSQKPFFMWVNVWDPHTPYRTPEAFGNPFAQHPLPAWYSEATRAEHWDKAGPHSPQEVNGFEPEPEWMYRNPELNQAYPTIEHYQPKTIQSLKEARMMFDGYDRGVAYADQYVGAIIQRLKDLGLYESTAIILSADHGENLGELWVYGDHQTADHFTHNVPMIIRWPGVTDEQAGTADKRLMYSIDAAATALEWATEPDLSNWDGHSFAGDFMPGKSTHHRDSVVLSQLAWCAQRSARWGNYICIETYHDGYHDYPRHMLFDLEQDPHEQHDLAPQRPDLVAKGIGLIHQWRSQAMEAAGQTQDPLDTVMAEGGPFHVRDEGPAYLQRLKATGREALAEAFAKRPRPYRS